MKRSFTLIELLGHDRGHRDPGRYAAAGAFAARESGRTATCAGGLRQLTAANILYSNDFGVFVKIRADKASTIYWYGANVSGGMDPGARKYDYTAGPLYTYYGRSARAIICPTLALTAGLDTGDLSRMASSGGYGYASRRYSTAKYYIGQISNGITRPGSIRNPSQAVMFGDSQISRNATGPQLCPHGEGMGNTYGTVGFRHARKANVSRADGHVAAEQFAAGDEANPLRQFRRPGGEPETFQLPLARPCGDPHRSAVKRADATTRFSAALRGGGRFSRCESSK